MLDGGLVDPYSHLRPAFADLIHPLVVAQDAQRVADRFVEGLGGHLDGVVGAGQIPAGDLARAEGHGIMVADPPFIRLVGMMFPRESNPAAGWNTAAASR